MTVLNDASRVYLGDIEVDSVFASGQKVWPTYGGPWIPGLLPGAVGWWDADDPATITKDGSGKVSEWRSLLDNRLLTQAAAASQPTSTIDPTNGRNVLTFGEGIFLSAPAGWETVPSPWSVLIVLRQTRADDWMYLLASDMGNPFMYLIPNTGYMNDRSGTNNPCYWTPQTTSIYDVVWSIPPVGGTERVWQDGVETSNAPVIGPAASWTQFHLAEGARLWGDVCELVLLDRELSEEDRISWNNYFKAKWGLP